MRIHEKRVWFLSPFVTSALATSTASEGPGGTVVLNGLSGVSAYRSLVRRPAAGDIEIISDAFHAPATSPSPV
jgi:hypothetical protein